MMGTYSDVKTFVSVKICGFSRSLRLKVHPAQVPGCAILSACKPCEISYGMDMYIYIYTHILGTAFSNNPSKGSRKTRPFTPSRRQRETVREISVQRTSQRSLGSTQQFPKQTGPSFPAQMFFTCWVVEPTHLKNMRKSN